MNCRSSRIRQLELAVRTGTSQRHVSFLGSGRSTPGRAMVVRLAPAGDATARALREAAVEPLA